MSSRYQRSRNVVFPAANSEPSLVTRQLYASNFVVGHMKHLKWYTDEQLQSALFVLSWPAITRERIYEDTLISRCSVCSVARNAPSLSAQYVHSSQDLVGKSVRHLRDHVDIAMFYGAKDGIR